MRVPRKANAHPRSQSVLGTRPRSRAVLGTHPRSRAVSGTHLRVQLFSEGQRSTTYPPIHHKNTHTQSPRTFNFFSTAVAHTKRAPSELQMQYFDMQYWVSPTPCGKNKHHWLMSIKPMNGAEMRDLDQFRLKYENEDWRLSQKTGLRGHLDFQTPELSYHPGSTCSFELDELQEASELLALFKSAVDAFVPVRFRLAQFEALGSYEEVAAIVQASKKRKTTEAAAVTKNSFFCAADSTCSDTLGKCHRCAESVCADHNQSQSDPSWLCRRCAEQR